MTDDKFDTSTPLGAIHAGTWLFLRNAWNDGKLLFPSGDHLDELAEELAHHVLSTVNAVVKSKEEQS